MPRAIGANARLLMIPEASYGTAPSGNWRRMPFLSCNLGAEQPLLDADVIGIGGNRDTGAPLLDTVTVAGQAVVPIDLINFGHWLRLLFGPPTTSGIRAISRGDALRSKPIRPVCCPATSPFTRSLR